MVSILQRSYSRDLEPVPSDETVKLMIRDMFRKASIGNDVPTDDKGRMYHGWRIINKPHSRGMCYVTVDGIPLKPVVDYSGIGISSFEWGNRSWGATNLAISIMADLDGVSDPDYLDAVILHFRNDIILQLPEGDTWTLYENILTRWMQIEAMKIRLS